MKVKLASVAVFSLLALMLFAPVAGFGQENSYKVFELTEDKKGKVSAEAISTLEKEMNDAASAGFYFKDFTYGLVVMNRSVGENQYRYEYRLLPTENESIMRAELQNAATYGYTYKGNYIFQPDFDKKHETLVLVVLERDKSGTGVLYEYQTMRSTSLSLNEKKLQEAANQLQKAADNGFRFNAAAPDWFLLQKPLPETAKKDGNLTANFQTAKTKACGTSEVNFSVKTDKAQHPAPEPEAGQAIVYFLRTGWSADQVKVAMDGEWLGTNKGNNYFYINADPGTHYFCAKNGIYYRVLALTLAPDKTYFLQSGNTDFDFLAVTEADGREKLEKLNLSISEKKR